MTEYRRWLEPEERLIIALSAARLVIEKAMHEDDALQQALDDFLDLVPLTSKFLVAIKALEDDTRTQMMFDEIVKMMEGNLE